MGHCFFVSNEICLWAKLLFIMRKKISEQFIISILFYIFMTAVELIIMMLCLRNIFTVIFTEVQSQLYSKHFTYRMS